MQSERTTAAIVGVLFIIATGTYMVGQSVYAPIVGAPDYLETIYPRRGAVLGGLFIETIGIVSIPLIALVFYPVLRRYDQRGALAYIGVRVLETIPLLLVTMHAWGLIAISQDYLRGSFRAGGLPQQPYFWEDRFCTSSSSLLRIRFCSKSSCLAQSRSRRWSWLFG